VTMIERYEIQVGLLEESGGTGFSGRICVRTAQDRAAARALAVQTLAEEFGAFSPARLRSWQRWPWREDCLEIWRGPAPGGGTVEARVYALGRGILA
jgi:hypothetical protein